VQIICKNYANSLLFYDLKKISEKIRDSNMRKKFAIFKEKYSYIISMLDKGYPYTDVILDLKKNHELDLSFNTFRSYLYRYRQELNQSIDKSKQSVSSDLGLKTHVESSDPSQSSDSSDEVEQPKQIFKNRRSGEAFIHKLLNKP
jgi:hypothetical protein